MNKTELVKRISEATGESKKVVRSILEHFVDEVTYALKNGEEVHLTNFGKFQPVERRERTFFNIAENRKETRQLPGKRVRFKPAKRLKEELAK